MANFNYDIQEYFTDRQERADLVMALAIAYYIRPQQSMKAVTKQKIKRDNMYKDFGIQETEDEDYGSYIEVI